MTQGAIWPEGYGRRILDQVDSTLDEAARIAPALTGPEWIMAHRQLAGRARRGRGWVDPVGNLSATLVLFPKEPLTVASLRSFVAALALLDTCVAVSGRSDGFALKWPNDVLLNGGKLAGILLESSGQGARLGHLSIGIGVNLLTTPEAVEPGGLCPVSLFSETGAQIDPETFLDYLAAAYARREATFISQGFEPIRTAWLASAARIGEVITARTGTTQTQGRFETVDSAGNLVLQCAQGRVAIPAAEVFF
ncbi:biotin--[acetyl-CoA-carboxylase] ligase [Pontibaca salina]|uniref:biotin--[biotin carboxyl-carrier protein] ligase n=1 Tax=Pontibaca salina TaxID=2795731 RepID=A0A934HU11_9RHOB|nr:biotin--[acetyl-CoA-carboxylase] ligase [Pontibaca salina]MBI6630218.1 biotin--[acetyl-CoA-carboxylase] ligase [Pontibaca salina]